MVRKVLITGASGMLGKDLSLQFQNHFEVVGAGRRALNSFPIPYFQQDLCDLPGTRNLFEREKPDIVFHTAAMTAVDDCETQREKAFKENVEVTRNVADASNRVNAQVVFFSTDYVYDGNKRGEYEETDTTAPLNYYGETKLAAEQSLRQTAEKFVIFRTSWLYGLNGKSFPRTILEKARETETLKVVSDQTGRPTFTRDMAKALCGLLVTDPRALEKVSGEIFHLANQGTASWAEFAKTILELGGFNHVRVEPITTTELQRPARRPLNSVLSLRKLELTLGIRLRPWKEALQHFILELQRTKEKI